MNRELFFGNFSLWSCVWQSTIFIVAGLIGSFIFRHRSSRAHQVLFLSMIAAVIVPAMGTLVNYWDLGMFVAKPVVMQPLAAPDSDYEASIEGTEYKPDVIKENPALAVFASKSSKFPWRLMFFYGWVVASLILVTRLVVTFVLGVRLLGRAHPLNCQKIQEAVHIASVKLRLAKDLKVHSSNGVRSAVIWCWSKRPILLVPTAAEKSGTKIDWISVLCHELAHYKRRDHISGLLAELVVCILPWHPLLWCAKSRLIKLSEQACDDWVVALGQSGTDYAESLLDLAPDGQMAFVPAVVTSRKGLAGRVTRILKDRCGNPTIGLRWALVAGIVAGLLAVGVAFAQTRPAEPQAKTKPEAKTYLWRASKSLHEAAAAGDIEQVKLHLSKGTAVNARDKRSRTALHHAASKGNIEIARLLISQGAAINANDENRQTPLHYASERGNVMMAELLIAKGADVNGKDDNGCTPVSFAMENAAGGCKEVVELLVSKGANVSALHRAAYRGEIEKVRQNLEEGMNVDARDDVGRTLMHYAASAGQMHIVEFLISKKADVDAKDKKSETPLHYAASAGWKNVCELLIAKGANVNAGDDWTPLHKAAVRGHKEIAILLIAKGANVNAGDGWTPLHEASCNGHKDVVEVLLANGADINNGSQVGWTPLHEAATHGYKDIAELLIARGANLNSGLGVTMTPLLEATSLGYKDIVDLLITKGADVDAEDKDGYTPLYWASWQGNKDMAELLTAKGATPVPAIHLVAREGDLAKVKSFIEEGNDINAKDKFFGRTPLYWALRADTSGVAEFLIAKGADVNAKDNRGWTPLHQACLDKKDVAELLIAKGADVNAKDNNGATPLHIVSLRAQKDMVELLIAKGANVNAENNGGRTPLDFAEQAGQKEIVELLLKHGAKE